MNSSCDGEGTSTINPSQSLSPFLFCQCLQFGLFDSSAQIFTTPQNTHIPPNSEKTFYENGAMSLSQWGLGEFNSLPLAWNQQDMLAISSPCSIIVLHLPSLLAQLNQDNFSELGTLSHAHVDWFRGIISQSTVQAKRLVYSKANELRTHPNIAKYSKAQTPMNKNNFRLIGSNTNIYFHRYKSSQDTNTENLLKLQFQSSSPLFRSISWSPLMFECKQNQSTENSQNNLSDDNSNSDTKGLSQKNSVNNQLSSKFSTSYRETHKSNTILDFPKLSENEFNLDNAPINQHSTLEKNQQISPTLCSYLGVSTRDGSALLFNLISSWPTYKWKCMCDFKSKWSYLKDSVKTFEFLFCNFTSYTESSSLPRPVHAVRTSTSSMSNTDIPETNFQDPLISFSPASAQFNPNRNACLCSISWDYFLTIWIVYTPYTTPFTQSKIYVPDATLHTPSFCTNKEYSYENDSSQNSTQTKRHDYTKTSYEPPKKNPSNIPSSYNKFTQHFFSTTNPDFIGERSPETNITDTTPNPSPPSTIPLTLITFSEIVNSTQIPQVIQSLRISAVSFSPFNRKIIETFSREHSREIHRKKSYKYQSSTTNFTDPEKNSSNKSFSSSPNLTFSKSKSNNQRDTCKYRSPSKRSNGSTNQACKTLNLHENSQLATDKLIHKPKRGRPCKSNTSTPPKFANNLHIYPSGQLHKRKTSINSNIHHFFKNSRDKVKANFDHETYTQNNEIDNQLDQQYLSWVNEDFDEENDSSTISSAWECLVFIGTSIGAVFAFSFSFMTPYRNNIYIKPKNNWFSASSIPFDSLLESNVLDSVIYYNISQPLLVFLPTGVATSAISLEFTHLPLVPQQTNKENIWQCLIVSSSGQHVNSAWAQYNCDQEDAHFPKSINSNSSPASNSHYFEHLVPDSILRPFPMLLTYPSVFVDQIEHSRSNLPTHSSPVTSILFLGYNSQTYSSKGDNGNFLPVACYLTVDVQGGSIEWRLWASNSTQINFSTISLTCVAFQRPFPSVKQEPLIATVNMQDEDMEAENLETENKSQAQILGICMSPNKALAVKLSGTSQRLTISLCVIPSLCEVQILKLILEELRKALFNKLAFEHELNNIFNNYKSAQLGKLNDLSWPSKSFFPFICLLPLTLWDVQQSILFRKRWIESNPTLEHLHMPKYSNDSTKIYTFHEEVFAHFEQNTNFEIDLNNIDNDVPNLLKYCISFMLTPISDSLNRFIGFLLNQSSSEFSATSQNSFQSSHSESSLNTFSIYPTWETCFYSGEQTDNVNLINFLLDQISTSLSKLMHASNVNHEHNNSAPNDACNIKYNNSFNSTNASTYNKIEFSNKLQLSYHFSFYRENLLFSFQLLYAILVICFKHVKWDEAQNQNKSIYDLKLNFKTNEIKRLLQFKREKFVPLISALRSAIKSFFFQPISSSKQKNSVCDINLKISSNLTRKINLDKEQCRICGTLLDKDFDYISVIWWPECKTCKSHLPICSLSDTWFDAFKIKENIFCDIAPDKCILQCSLCEAYFQFHKLPEMSEKVISSCVYCRNRLDDYLSILPFYN